MNWYLVFGFALFLGTCFCWFIYFLWLIVIAKNERNLEIQENDFISISTYVTIDENDVTVTNNYNFDESKYQNFDHTVYYDNVPISYYEIKDGVSLGLNSDGDKVI